MLFPFRTSTIFRNRWMALLWAAGICFMAAQVVDTVSGVTAKKDGAAVPPAGSQVVEDSRDPVAVAVGNGPPPGPMMADHIAR